MKIFGFLMIFLISMASFGQDDFLAKQYFNDGDYDKALAFYERLTAANPGRNDYVIALVSCYQQLEQYDKQPIFY